MCIGCQCSIARKHICRLSVHMFEKYWLAVSPSAIVINNGEFVLTVKFSSSDVSKGQQVTSIDSGVRKLDISVPSSENALLGSSWMLLFWISTKARIRSALQALFPLSVGVLLPGRNPGAVIPLAWSSWVNIGGAAGFCSDAAVPSGTDCKGKIDTLCAVDVPG